MKQTRRKRFTVVGVICMLLMCVCVSPVSAAAATPTVAAGAVIAEKDGVAKVTVSLEANPGLWGIRLEVGYDHEALTLQSAEAGDVFAKEEITPPPDLAQESYWFMADRAVLSNTTKNGVLVTLTFAAKSGVELKDYPITLTVADALDVEGNTVALTCAAGKITVVDCLHDGEKTVVNKKDATETEEGYTGDIKCADCSEILEHGTVIPKLKGTSSSSSITGDPTTSSPTTGNPTTSSPTAGDPPTGDSNNLPLMAAQLFLSGGAILALIIKRKNHSL